MKNLIYKGVSAFVILFSNFVFMLEAQSLITEKTLSDKEIKAVLYSLEEEKMARDVYDFLFEKWGLFQFDNIRRAERNHMSSMERLLLKYDVPYQILGAGKFSNSRLQIFYNQLIKLGSLSEKDALLAGAKVEDIDIFDLQEQLKIVSNTDLKTSFERLLCGSRNHMRAFQNALKGYKVSYEPEYISNAAFTDIMNNGNERCGIKSGNGSKNGMRKAGIGNGRRGR